MTKERKKKIKKFFVRVVNGVARKIASKIRTVGLLLLGGLLCLIIILGVAMSVVQRKKDGGERK